MDALQILCAPFLFLAFYVISYHFFHKLRNHPPSPFPALPIIGHFHLLSQPFHRALIKISNRYGPVLLLRFGSRPVLLVSSPSAAEECFTKNDVVLANRPKFLGGKIFGYEYTSLAWSSYGEHWRNLRKLSTIEVLSAHRIQVLSEIRTDEAKSLIRRLFRSSQNTSDNMVEVKSAVYDYTFNVITRMVTGKRFFGEKVENADEAKLYKEIGDETTRLVIQSGVLDYFPVLKWIGYKGIVKEMKKMQERRNQFMHNIIEQHRQKTKSNGAGENGGKNSKTILEVLLGLQETDADYYSDEIIISLLYVLLHAGSETSATTLEWAFSYLLENPRIMKKAKAEIDLQVGHTRLVEESDMGKLPYIRCIVNETLRLQPAAPLLVPHFSGEECHVGGYRVPKGTIVLVNAWGIQRDPKVWEDPETFNPERFESFKSSKDHAFKFMPFGSGRRSCPGENLAIRVVELALGLLLQCFDWENPSKETIDKTDSSGFIAAKLTPLVAKCSPRSEMVTTLSQI
ncbi:cytochrome P450 81Q32-like [Ipomoea triloba]|uniref:cytochrome P450 81Q32-like n=1 Tax=Ipomoea triloba TaxID=35885 RepID=UPI00125E45A5|nr:cytochrome P450 81Q32-like [Ipomoea triloba]